jgi:hypothetical protein
MIVRFTNGEVRDVGTLADEIVVLGLDADGYVVVRWTEVRPNAEPFVMTYALTACCNASAKGCGPYSDDDEGYIGCRACYAEVAPKLGGEPDPVVVPVVPAGDPKIGGVSVSQGTPAALNQPDPATATAASGRSPKGRTMTRTKATPAAEQFAALGLTDQSAWSPAMNLAVKQKWANLPVDRKVDDLRAELAAIAVDEVPTVDMLEGSAMPQHGDAREMTRDEAVAEHARLLRNAKVNAWRKRNQIQAALDARALKFAQMRQGKALKVKGGSHDAAPALAVSA